MISKNKPKRPNWWRLIMSITIILTSGEFSARIKTPDIEAELLKGQSPITEVVEILDELLK